MASGSANLQRTVDDDKDSGSSPGWDIAIDSINAVSAGWNSEFVRFEIAVKGTPAGPTTLISNTRAATSSASKLAWARAFTTGDNPGGYGLTRAKVAFVRSHTQSASSAVLVRIFSTAGNGRPVVELARLIGPERISFGLNTFTAPPNTVLDPGTSYALVITGSPSNGAWLEDLPVGLQLTQQTSKHGDSLPGWRLAIEGRHSWRNETWITHAGMPIFSLEGTVRDAETVTEVWSATMHIGATADDTVDGYCDGPCFGEPSMESFGSLEDDSGFVGESYSVESIRFDTPNKSGRLMFTVVNPSSSKTFRANDDGLLLRIGITDYDLNDSRTVYEGHATKTRYEWATATSTVPAEARPWNATATSTASTASTATSTTATTTTAVVKLIRRATSTGPSFAGCDGTGIWCATVEAGHHDDGSDSANDYYGYVAPGAGTIVDGSPEFTYDGEAYTVTVAGRREGGGADTYVIGIDPAPPFDFLLGVDGRTLESTAASTGTATSTDGISAGVLYEWSRGTGTAWDIGDRFDIGLIETAATIASATTVVTITAENAYAVLHGDYGDALEYRLERTATDGALSVWVDLSSGSPEFVKDGDRRKKVDFADGASTKTLSIPAWQLTGIPELGEVVEGGAVVARLAEGSSYAVGTPGAAEERVVVWVAGFDARSYEVDERDGKVAVSLTARYVGGGLPDPAFNSRHYLSVSSTALGDVEATSPEDYAATSDVIGFPEDSTDPDPDPDPDNGFSDVDGDGTYEMTRTFDQGIVWDAEDEGGLDPERFLLLLEITPGLAPLTQFAWPDGRRCAAVATSNPDHPDNCLAVVAIDDSPRTAIENVSIISAPAAAPDTYGAGERIMAAVRFAADVTVAVSSATSTATATMQVGTKDVKLPYAYQKFRDTVVFGPYEVQPVDMDADGVDLQRSDNPFIGIRVDSSSFQIVADGIAIRDTNGDEVFPYARLPDGGVFAQHKVDGSLEPPPVLVSNTGLGHFRLATDGASAQGFHTGGSAPAEDEPGDEREIVTVHSVGILVEGCSACPADPAQARVRVYRAGPNAYTPAGEPLFALTAPASVATSTVARFTAPEDAVLRADADYHLVFDDADGGTFPWALPVTNGNAEDAHSQPGWTIEDVRGSRLAEGSVWTSRTFVVIFDIRGATSTVANIPATGKPRILGGAREGVAMTVDTSAIADGNGMAAAEFEYFWLTATTTADVPVRIAGATADTYTPDAADVGKHIAVGVAFTDDVGYPESSISDFTPPVASSTRPDLPPTGMPTIKAATTLEVGDTLTADASSVTGDPDGMIDVVFAYAWFDAVTGEELGTGPQYHLRPGDEDRTIELRATYTDNAGFTSTIPSLATMAVAAQPADGCRPDRIQLTADGDIGYCHDNEYRYVCGDSWDIDDANVACRQAGYRSANSFTTDGTGLSTAFWLDEVECTGAEATLGLCAHDGWGVHDCGSTDLAGVGCEAAGSKTLSALSLTDADGNKVVLSSVWEDEFDPVVADYTARVASTTVAVVVAATSTDPAATVTIDRTAATTTVTATVPFEDGTVLPITVRVTATGGATMDYRIVVARGDGAAAIATATSTDATLRALTVNDGTNDVTLAPPFASSTHVYTAAVGNAATTVTLTATVNHPGASVTGVTLGGTAVADDEFFDGITIPSLVEGDNVIVVTVTAEDASTQDYTVTVTRLRRTTAMPGVTVSESSLTVTEEDTTGDSYTVVLDSQPTASVTVTVAGHSGTGVTPDMTTLTFTTVNWETVQEVTVTAAHDANTAGEMVTLTHSAASTDSDYDGIAIAEVAVTVEDNDTAQVTGVRAVPEGTMLLTVRWTRVSNATGYQIQWKSGGQNYSSSRQAPVSSGSDTDRSLIGLANGTEYTIRMRAVRSGANNGPWSDDAMGTPRAPGVTVSESSLTVTEEDAAGDSYTVVLKTRPTASVTVTVAGHAGTEVLPSPATLTFTRANWETAQTVNVTANNDADTTDDTVTLTHSAASTDSDYDGIAIAEVAVTVEDNDTAQVTGVTVDSGNAQLVVGWDAVGNATGYRVQWKSGGQSYNTSRQAIIASGSTTSHTISSLANGTEYTLRVRAVRSGANEGPWSDDATGTPEVPTAPGVTLSVSSLTVTEEDTAGDSYTVVLDTLPTANVVVTVAGHAGTDVTLTSTTLTFTTVNWETAQEVTVTAANDTDTAGETVTLTHSAASTDSDYGGIAIADVTVTVEDDDTAQVTGVTVDSGNAQLVVGWDAVGNATGYRVQWKSGGQSYNTSRQAIDRLGFDHEPHDPRPDERHRIHPAGESGPDRRQRRPVVGRRDGHAGGAGRAGRDPVEDVADGDRGGHDRRQLHGGARHPADGERRGDGGRARGHGRDSGHDHADVHDGELGDGAAGERDGRQRCGHHGGYGDADPQRGEHGQRLRRHRDRRRDGDGGGRRHRAGDGGDGRTGQRATGGGLGCGGQCHRLPGAVEVRRPELQHQPPGDDRLGFDHEPHDPRPDERHRIHDARESGPDRRQRRPVVGRRDGHAGGADRAGRDPIGIVADGDGGGHRRRQLHGGPRHPADGERDGDGGRALGHGRDRDRDLDRGHDRDLDPADVHDGELEHGPGGDGHGRRRCGHGGRHGDADPQRGEHGQRLRRHRDRRRDGDGGGQRHRAGDGGDGRTGQRATGGGLGRRGQRHRLRGAVEVRQPGPQHQPPGDDRLGYDHEPHDLQPDERHRIHDARESGPDGRQRRPVVGQCDGHPGGADRAGRDPVEDGADGDRGGHHRRQLHGGPRHPADGERRGDGRRARGHGRDRDLDHADLHDGELEHGAGGDGHGRRGFGHDERYGDADPQRGEHGQRLRRHRDCRRDGDGGGRRLCEPRPGVRRRRAHEADVERNLRRYAPDQRAAGGAAGGGVGRRQRFARIQPRGRGRRPLHGGARHRADPDAGEHGLRLRDAAELCSGRERRGRQRRLGHDRGDTGGRGSSRTATAGVAADGHDPGHDEPPGDLDGARERGSADDHRLRRAPCDVRRQRYAARHRHERDPHGPRTGHPVLCGRQGGERRRAVAKLVDTTQRKHGARAGDLRSLVLHRDGRRRGGDGDGRAERGRGLVDDHPADTDEPGRRDGRGLHRGAAERDVRRRADVEDVHGDGGGRLRQRPRRERADRLRTAAAGCGTRQSRDRDRGAGGRRRLATADGVVRGRRRTRRRRAAAR